MGVNSSSTDVYGRYKPPGEIQMYVFGGEDESATLLNDLHVLTFSIAPASTAACGSSEAARNNSDANVGGFKQSTSRDSESPTEDAGSTTSASALILTCTWSQPTVYGEPPSAREGHIMVHNGRSLVIFGGYNGVASLNDLYSAHV